MKALRTSLYGLATAFLGLLTVVGALWLWSDTSTSLSTSLNQLAHYLPAGQTLETQEVTGSLRNGGTLGLLRWRQGDISVEVRDLTIA